jgi:hypothetical protein
MLHRCPSAQLFTSSINIQTNFSRQLQAVTSSICTPLSTTSTHIEVCCCFYRAFRIRLNKFLYTHDASSVRHQATLLACFAC